MLLPRFFALLVAALSVSAGVIGAEPAQSAETGSLSITDPWARATPPMAQTAGGYLTIENSGAEPDQLLGVASPVAARVEIHEMAMTNGTMTMRHLDSGVALPAGDAVSLAPGGFHIMFMGLNEIFAEGQTVPVTLSFEKAGDVEIFLQVLGIGARGPQPHHNKDATGMGSGQ